MKSEWPLFICLNPKSADMFRQLTTRHAAAECLVGLLPARHHEAVAECLDKLRIRLASADECRHDSSTTSAQDAHQMFHLDADVVAHRSCIGKAQFLVRTA